MSIQFSIASNPTGIPVHPLSQSTETKQRVGKTEIKTSEAHLLASIDTFNKVSKRALTFNIHKELDRVYVQVIDQETDEIVREVPPEKILDLIASMMKSAGLIVDRQV